MAGLIYISICIVRRTARTAQRSLMKTNGFREGHYIYRRNSATFWMDLLHNMFLVIKKKLK